jgi:hypothetical protein
LIWGWGLKQVDTDQRGELSSVDLGLGAKAGGYRSKR